jgi:hypothetical protein
MKYLLFQYQPEPVRPAAALCMLLQALSQDEEDVYTHSSWANSKSLKQAFAGINSVRIPR